VEGRGIGVDATREGLCGRGCELKLTRLKRNFWSGTHEWQVTLWSALPQILKATGINERPLLISLDCTLEVLYVTDIDYW
jgi:hypothetical protein